MKLGIALLAGAAALLAGCGQSGGVRPIRIVGSSTVYPFTTAVAEQFARVYPAFGAPTVESTGTGSGIKLFCGGVGINHPDAVNASRRMKASEAELCAANGVRRIIELPVGIDGLAMVESVRARPFRLTVQQLYEAIAKQPYGRPQTAETWADIDPSLPATPIQVYGPPPTSGTRDSLAEIILTKGCDANPAMKALKKADEERHKTICTTIREDGAFIEAGENDNLLVQKVTSNPGAIGVLGFSFLERNTDRVRGVPLDGVTPTLATISDFSYPGARPLYIYVKGEHLEAIAGLKPFVAEYARAWNPGGYLSRRGLIPSPGDMRAEAAATAASLTPLNRAELK